MGHGRAPGLHLGTVIRRIRQLRGDKIYEDGNEQDGGRMFAGFAWERALELAFHALGVRRDGVLKQLRLELNGIHMTPDGLDLDVPCLEEYKLTWKGMKRLLDTAGYQDWHAAFVRDEDGNWVLPGEPPPGLSETLAWNFLAEFKDWNTQMQGYLKGIQETMGLDIKTARLFVYWVRGDYKWHFGGPQVTLIELRWTQEEIDDNWRKILTAAEGLREEAA